MLLLASCYLGFAGLCNHAWAVSALQARQVLTRSCVVLLQSNGYRFMFLSSRAIAQASTTRDYLQRLNQDGHRLPAGAHSSCQKLQRSRVPKGT